MEKGWIKLNRQITEHWIFEDAERFKAWIDLLLMVNHEDRKILVDGNITVIKRGQVLTSICKLAKRWNWSRKRTKNFITALENDGMVTSRVTSRYTTLNIVNYGKFQDVGTSRVAGKVTGKVTSKVATKEQVTLHKQELKNEEELKNEKEEELDQLPDGVVDSDEEDDPDAWWKEIAEEEGIPLSECE